MTDLTEFLLARYAAEQKLADAAAEAGLDPRWEFSGLEGEFARTVAYRGHYADCSWVLLDNCDNRMGVCDCGLPSRVLAECSAHRQIVELHRFDRNPQDQIYGSMAKCLECGGYSTYAGLGDAGYKLPYPCPTLRLLALPYRDHPDFNPSWAIGVNQ